MVGSIIVMNKPHENIDIKFERGLLNQTTYCNCTTKLKEANTKQTRLRTYNNTIMVLNNKVSNMVTPNRLISSRRSRFNNSNIEITMTDDRGSSWSVERSWQSSWSTINNLETVWHPASRI
jgi:hypothetical protein